MLELAFSLAIAPLHLANLGAMERENALSVPLAITDELHLGPIRRCEINMRVAQVVRLEAGTSA
jgi:hypothetical protein